MMCECAFPGTACDCGREKLAQAYACCQQCFAKLPPQMKRALRVRPAPAAVDIEVARRWLAADRARQAEKLRTLAGRRGI